MARSYSKYEYETSPRKLEPYYAPNKKTTSNKKNEKNSDKEIKHVLLIAFRISLPNSLGNAGQV